MIFSLDSIFVFIFLAIFPFGQILRIGILQPIDVVVGMAAIYTIIKRLPQPDVFRYLKNFILAAGFSWLLSLAFFWQKEVLYGALYLIRLSAYFYFLIYVINFVKKNKNSKKIILDSLLTISIISAIFGWIQYFIFPALNPFMVWGWDEHLFRLAGTFLDPTFVGLIIVFGLVISIVHFINEKKYPMLVASLFLLISLAFTYSRASYLAFFAALIVILYFYKKLKYFIVIAGAFLLLMLILPTSKNHVLSFTREFSAIARIENYTQSLNIFKSSPVFGVGYDNLCLAKSKTVGYINFESHSCSGSDSSLLFILTTIGAIGFMLFIYAVWNIGKSVNKSPNFVILASSFFALLIHCTFSNSLVYPWVIGYMIVLLGTSLEGNAS